MARMGKTTFAQRLKPEDILHANVCKYVLFKYPGAVIHHSPNEGKRTKFEQYLLKVLHVSSGFPDLLIIYHTTIIAIELKVGKNKPTENQTSWLQILQTFMPVKCCWGFDEAVNFIDGNLKKRPVKTNQAF